MNLVGRMMDIGLLGLFAAMFAGYSLFVYPVEKISQKFDPEVKQNKVKYAPQV